jgi:hypothetical protein
MENDARNLFWEGGAGNSKRTAGARPRRTLLLGASFEAVPSGEAAERP